MKVYVKTPARLHFGLIDMNGDMGRFFGGLGVAIDRPNVILQAQTSEGFSVTGEKAELATSLAKRFLETYHINAGVSIHVEQSIPEHAGLGSGTQLALAVASALAKLFQVKATIQELSLAMGRVKRTGVGTAVFGQGGFVVDGGKKMKKGSVISESFPPLIFSQPFPEDWKFVVAVPDVKRGLAKTEEKDAFDHVPPMPVEIVGRLCQLTMMKLLPALLDRDIGSFGDALTQIQVVIGGYFADVQGGTFSSSAAAETILFMKKCGAYGVGQSSWGPAVYGLAQNVKDAEKLRAEVEAFLQNRDGGQVFVANANNRGATIKYV
ncbi:MAG TPA: kinase [Candidatus Bathyarchaeota archaeon]|nr:kinase [Candidatus Bathyarchaeota archaeon]